MSRYLWQTAYSFVLHPLLLAGLYVVGLRNRKVRETLHGRRGLWGRLRAQLSDRDENRPLVWFHVSSAGEFLQALPVMERLMGAGSQCALTLSSVSGLRWAQRRKADFPGLILVDYLPFDFRANARRLIALLRPRAVVYVKYDLWPNLVWEAGRAGVPQYLVSATLHERSARVTSALGRSLYRSLYSSLEGIFAVTGADAQRFLETCPGHTGVRVVGDTRFDSVLDRRRALQPPPLPDWVRQGTVLIVGSSWPQDEAHIFPPLREALEAFPHLVLLLVPHEIDETHLHRIEGTFAGHGVVRFTRLTASAPGRSRVLLVDTVGQLAALYAYGTVAYVGGAFSTGVHNVMEPSAMGVPAVFGPFFQNSPEAETLVGRGWAFTIRDGETFEQAVFPLLADVSRAQEIGRAAAAYIETSAGAAQRCFELIRPHLG